MPRPYSEDLRERIVAAVESGTSRRSAAGQFGVSVSCVIKLVQRAHETGSVAPAQIGGYRDYALAGHEALVRRLVKAQPDMILDELREALAKEGVRVSRTSIWRYLSAIRLTLKKRHSTPASRPGRMSPLRARPGEKAKLR
jgi:transposase